MWSLARGRRGSLAHASLAQAIRYETGRLKPSQGQFPFDAPGRFETARSLVYGSWIFSPRAVEFSMLLLFCSENP